MARPAKPENSVRTHFIPEWADRRGVSQADIVRAIHADKATVSRWWGGAIPSEKYLIPLAAYFHVDVPALFRDPDDDWLARFFRRSTAEEKRRAEEILKLTFPDRAA